MRDMVEKKLIVARYFIEEKNKGNIYEEKDVFCKLCNFFPSDYKIGKYKFVLEHNENEPYLTIENPNIPNSLILEYTRIWKYQYQNICYYIMNHTLEECDYAIVNTKYYNYRRLVQKYKPLGYYVRHSYVDTSIPTLTQYTILKKHFKKYVREHPDIKTIKTRTGCYSNLLEYADELKLIEEKLKDR